MRQGLCPNCIEFKPIIAADLCWACYRYAHRHGVMRIPNYVQKRDQAIALEYVRLGNAPKKAEQIHEKTGIHIRTIYRAINRQLEWARGQAA